MKKETGKKRIWEEIRCFIYFHTWLSALIGGIIALVLGLLITIGIVLSNGGMKQITEYPNDRYEELNVAMRNFDIEGKDYKEYLDNLGVEYSAEYFENNEQEGTWEIILRKPDSLMFRPTPEIKATNEGFIINKENLQESKRNYDEQTYKNAVIINVGYFMIKCFLLIYVLIVILIVKIKLKPQKGKHSH